MKEKNNIDNLFKNVITGYKIEPSTEVWENIEARFFNRSAFVYKWYAVATALLVLLLAAGGIWFYNQNGDAQNQMVDQIEMLDNENDIEKNIGEKNKITLLQGDEQIEEELNNGIDDKQIKQTNDLDISAESSIEAVPITAIRENEKVNSNIELTNETVINKNELALIPFGYIQTIEPKDIGEIVSTEFNLIVPQLQDAVTLYLEKQKRNHFYAGLSADGGMIYYPSTKDQFIWSVDLTAGLTIAEKFFVETGIGYLDTKERGIYAIDLKSYDSVGYYNQVESFEVDPSNPDEIQYNTKEVIVYDSIDHYSHTTPYFKYQYIKIPLSFGYKFYQRDSFTASVRAGIIFNYMVSKSIPDAQYYNPEYTVVKTINQTPERVDWNFQWQLAIRLNYKVSKAFSISAEPVFTKYLNSIYDTDKGYTNVKPYSMGLRIGVYYGF